MKAPRQRKVTSWGHGSPANDAQATVVHAGRRVPVVVMGTMDGMQRPGVSGEDVLCRAEDGGSYYLVRQTCRGTPHPRWGRVRLPTRLRRRWVRDGCCSACGTRTIVRARSTSGRGLR